MAESGGEIAGSAKPSYDGAGADAGNDRLSALPDDILVLTLLRLDSAAAAGRTSVLSRRWRRVWTLLPELRFSFSPALHLIAAALAAHEAPLRHLFVGTQHAALEPLADCLRATTVSLNLGFLCIVMPPAGVFARLTELTLISVWFHGPPELIGDAVSSPRCPSLQKLGIKCTFGLANLAIHSESLLQVKLQKMHGLRQLTVDAPVLQELDLIDCFDWNQPVSAPQLVSLFWKDAYDPSSVLFGNMEQPQSLTLTTSNFYVYGPNDFWLNLSCLRLFEQFQAIHKLHLGLIYPKVRQFLGRGMQIPALQYHMRFNVSLDLALLWHVFIGMFRVLPFYLPSARKMLGYKLYNDNVKQMTLETDDYTGFAFGMKHAHWVSTLYSDINEGHAFGASVFHVLRMYTSLTKFALVQGPENDLEAQSKCQSSCVCDEPTNWKTVELTLNRLHAVLIIDMKGTDHEVAFLKQLFSWATALKSVKILYTSITASRVKEVHEKVLSLAKPETRVTLAAKQVAALQANRQQQARERWPASRSRAATHTGNSGGQQEALTQPRTANDSAGSSTCSRTQTSKNRRRRSREERGEYLGGGGCAVDGEGRPCGGEECPGSGVVGERHLITGSPDLASGGLGDGHPGGRDGEATSRRDASSRTMHGDGRWRQVWRRPGEGERAGRRRNGWEVRAGAESDENDSDQGMVHY
ncbi:hypothetical protein EJB05_13927, partial [Eragrostis curvula]